jgi:hypothetical protein
MPIRPLVVAALLALLLCGAAEAAPVTVQLRVEGTNRTIFEGPVTTDGKTITKGGHTVVCDGTLNGGNPTPGPTATSALDDAALSSNFDWDADFYGDFFVTRVADVISGTWGLAVNFQQAPVGGCQQQVHTGDGVLFASEFFAGPNFAQEPLLKLEAPQSATTGQPFSVRVTDGQTGAPFAGATVAAAQSGPDGAASVMLGSAGVVTLKAEASGAIRSNAVSVCVSEPGAPACAAAVPGESVKDSAAPRARIKGPRDGRHYRRGPRLLSGTAADNVGVTKVKLALRRHARGKPCRWWSSTSERFAGRGCARKVFFAIGSSTSWSYLLPRRLEPGRYVLDVKAFDRARNRDERFVRGTNRVVFYVGRGYGARAAASRRSTPARVPVLLAGRSSLARAVVRAKAALVRVGHRRCRVGASTPLAALAPLLRRERIGYRIRDYGSCSPKTAAGSGQLFVRKIGHDANGGNDGWFYKVNDRAPEVGAADPASRVRSGDRLLWFYCLFDEGARSCQRSLRIVPLSGSAAGDLRVRVRGYDNAGRWKAIAGATVATGPLTATSAANGVARLAAGEGSYTLTAQKEGLIDAFPLKVNVR